MADIGGGETNSRSGSPAPAAAASTAATTARRAEVAVQRIAEELEASRAETERIQAMLNESNQHIADLIFRREGAPASTSARSEGGTRKTAKVTVPIFYDDDTKDTVTFEVWLRSMKNRLEVNHDWFADNTARMTDIEAHVGGTVSKNLLPYLKDSHPDQVTTSEALLQHLEETYLDVTLMRSPRLSGSPSTSTTIP